MPFFEYSEPDANIAIGGSLVINAGDGASVPGSAWQAIADTLPDGWAAGPGQPWTRIEIPLAAFETNRFSLDNQGASQGTTATPTGADTRCEAVRIWAHAATIGGTLAMYIGNGPQNTELQGETGFSSNGNQEIKVGPWVTQAMGASVGTFKEWETADLNDLRLKMISMPGALGLSAAHVYRVYYTKRMVARPYAQIDTPQAESTVASVTPRISWSQQNQGRPAEPQKKFHVKVFKRTTVDASGAFDPETASALVSTLVSSSANFYDVPSGKLNFGVEYVAYVKVATKFNSDDWWGPWSTRKNFRTQSRPLVDVTAPTGTIIDTARPEVQWDFSDVDGDKQAFYRVVIHQRPGAAWPSNYDPFAVANEVNLRYDSGLVASSDEEHTIGVNLVNSTNYRAFVYAVQSLPVRLESNFDFSEFTTGFSGPMAPTLAAGASGDKITLLVTPATPTVTNKGMTVGGAGWAETPDHTDLDHATDFEYRFEIAMLDWTPEQEAVIAAKGDFDEGNGAWIFSVMPDGKFRLRISTDGTAGPIKDYISSAAPGLTAGQRRFIRFTHDNNTPGGSTTVTFSHSATDSGYANIGTAPVLSGIENVHNSTAPLRLGARGSLGLDGWQGYFYFASGRSSIGGTVVTSPTFTGLPLGNAPFTDAQSKTYTFKGDAEVEFKENPNADAFDVERSLDNGATYEFFRVEHRPNRRNLFKSGFEDGVTVWTATGSTCTATNSAEAARTGTRSLKIVKLATGANATVEEDALSATLNPVQAGEEIQDGFWVYVAGAADRLVIPTIEWVTAANASNGTVVGAFQGVTSGLWTFVSVQGIAPANTVKWRMTFSIANIFGSVPTGEVFYIDDVEGYLASEKNWLSRSSQNLPKTVSPFLLVDHEVPFGRNVAYRARGKTFGLGTEITSPYSTPAIASVAENRVWFKSTTDPRLNYTFKTQDRWLEMSRRKSRSIYEAIGRQNPIVIKHAPDHDAFSISIVVLGQNIRDVLERLLVSNHTMFVQTPKGGWWAEISGDIAESASLWDDLRAEQDAWLLTIPFQEVDR